MSPKDLKTIHFLNKILDAGVEVLKIEGRARGADYVYTTVSCYREAVEAWQRGEYDSKAHSWDGRLAAVFNRGFWDGYYLGQRLGEWTSAYGSQATQKKVFAAKCTNFFKQISVAEFYLEAVPEIKEGDALLITGETTGAYYLTAADLHDAEGHPCHSVPQGQPFAIRTERLIHRGDRLFLLQNTL